MNHITALRCPQPRTEVSLERGFYLSSVRSRTFSSHMVESMFDSIHYLLEVQNLLWKRIRMSKNYIYLFLLGRILRNFIKLQVSLYYIGEVIIKEYLQIHLRLRVISNQTNMITEIYFCFYCFKGNASSRLLKKVNMAN